jgi:arylsulfatase A-like enzyme
MRNCLLFLISNILLVQTSFGYSTYSDGNQPANVLLILTDNQSFYELSSNGHAVIQTPNIDKFADKAVVFDNLYATPYCSPSRAELLTGKYALRSGVHNTIGGVSNIHPDQLLVSDYLKNAGYKTAVFGKWHLGNEYPYHPKYRGFDKAFIHDGGGIGQLPDYYENTHINGYYNNDGKIVPTKGFSTDVLFQEAKQFIEENKDNPFFCFISTPATHAPWQAHPQKLKDLLKRSVDAEPDVMALYSMVENIDDNVGSLLDLMDSLGLRENTLVIFATDQGMKYRGLDNPPEEKRFGLTGNVFDYAHKVFCMVQYPKLTLDPHHSTTLTGIIDIAPTILDNCGIQVPSEMDGKSLMPLLSKNNKKNWDDDRTLIVQCPRQRKRMQQKQVSLKTKRWRLINGTFLFDVAQDPYQLEDVSHLHPNVMDSLNGLYISFWQSLPAENELLPALSYLGAQEAPETRLNAMDWYEGDAPWTQNDILSKNKQGVWAVKICRSGNYTFELRRFPREAPYPIEATKAALTLGTITKERSIDRTDQGVIFELKLEEGEYDLQTHFVDEHHADDKIDWGAYFAYIRYRNDDH